MILLNSSFDNFAREIINNDYCLILFGAGAIGEVVLPELLYKCNLIDRCIYYVDNDKRLWNKYIKVKNKTIPVLSPNHLHDINSNCVIMINISRFYDVLNQIEAIPETQNIKCYITPIMLLENLKPRKNFGKNDEIIQFNQHRIPKKIHYMWLGGKALPSRLQKCIDSWKRFCPDYEIIEWNENNYDISKNKYMKQAYENKAYGFVPDYARFDIIYNHGGIYFDTDVELIKNIDNLLYQDAFCSVEKWQVINPGGGFGAIKGHPTIKAFLKAREDIDFINEDGSLNKKTCAYYDTKTAINLGYKINGQTQNIMGMTIYTYDYFHPYDYMSGNIDITSNTFSIHHFNGGWLDESLRKANQEVVDNFNHIFSSISKEIY